MPERSRRITSPRLVRLRRPAPVEGVINLGRKRVQPGAVRRDPLLPGHRLPHPGERVAHRGQHGGMLTVPGRLVQQPQQPARDRGVGNAVEARLRDHEVEIAGEGRSEHDHAYPIAPVTKQPRPEVPGRKVAQERRGVPERVHRRRRIVDARRERLGVASIS